MNEFYNRDIDQSGFNPNSKKSWRWLSWMSLCLMFLMGTTAFAQVSGYAFSQSSGSYTPITGGTVPVSGSGIGLDDGIFSVTLPTPFVYNGTSITTVGFSSNGYLIMGNVTSPGYTPISSNVASSGIISALGMDLVSASGSSEARWEQIGNEIIFQWKEFKRYNATAFTDESVSFQIRLNTSTKAIVIVYSGESTVNSSTTKIPQVGLRGSTNSDYNARRLTTTVPDATPSWNDTGAATSNAHNVRFTSTSPAAYPAAGQTFSWAPIVLVPCITPTAVATEMLFGTTTATAINGSFTAASPAPSKYLVVRSTSNTAPSPVDGTAYTVGSTTLGVGTLVKNASNSLTFSDSCLTAGTTYYYYVFSYNDSCTGAPFYNSAALSGSHSTLCATGTGLLIDSITSSSANLSWTGTGEYIVEYGLTGFTPGTDGTPGVGGTVAVSQATSPALLTGLTGATSYKVFVRQECPLGGFSANSIAGSFATACEAITVFPSNQPFDTYLPNVCWNEGNLGDIVAGPTVISASNSDWSVDGFLNVGSTGAAKMNIDAANGSEWIISPFYTIPATGYRVKYSVGATQWNTSTAITTPWETDDYVQLLVSTSNTNWTVLATYDSNNVPSYLGQIDQVDLSAYSGQTVQFAFLAFEGATNGSADIDFFIDNFTVEMIPVLPPDCATGHSPADLSTGIFKNGTLSWTAATGGPSSYDVYFGTSTNPSLVVNQTGTSYTPPTMAGNTTYYWKIEPRNANGAASCVERSFTTGTEVQYCTPSSSGSATYIDSFSTTLGSTNISNATGYTAGGYQDNFAGTAVSSFATSSFDYSFTAVGGSLGAAIWIDWDGNGLFESGERVFVSSGYVYGPFNGTINIPLGTALGDYRMRVMVDYNNSAPSNTCATATRAETEDYKITITAPPSCAAPIELVSSAVTTSTATLSWTASVSNPSNGYDVYFSTTSTAPDALTTPNVNNHPASPLNATGLSSSSTYYWWVRSDCGSETSTWTSGGSFNTITPPPTNENCAGAIALVCNATAATYPSAGSTAVAPAGCTLGSKGIWFSFVGTSGEITINSTATFDHKLSIQTGSCSELTWIACKDGSTGAETYTIANSVLNQTYYVYVAHYSGTSTTTGNVTISIACAVVCPTGIWTGTTSTAFNTASNWADNMVPEACTNVTVNVANPMVISSDVTVASITLGATANVTVDGILNVGNITVAEGGQMTVANNAVVLQTALATNTGLVSVQRASSLLYRQDYTLWSSPVSGMNLRSFSPATLYNRFSYYDTTLGTVGDYVAPINAANINTLAFNSAEGYLIRMPNDWPQYVSDATAGTSFTGTFKGVLNNGTITKSLSLATTQLNLVGNPYPSPISISAFFTANPNIEQQLYFWRKRNDVAGSGYVTYTPLMGMSNSMDMANTIKAGQGFFVKSITATTLTFNNGMRTSTQGTPFLKSANETNELHRFWLSLSNSTGVAGQTLIGYATGATQGVDNGYDALYFNDAPLALTSIINNAEYIIQGRALPFVNSDIVTLGFKTNEAGSFTISLANFDGLFAQNQDIFLKDNATNALQNLKLANYTFTTQPGVFNERFEVHYNTTLGTNNPIAEANKILIGVKNQQIKINAGSIVMEKIELIDVAGRVIYTVEGVNATTATIENIVASNQMLIVRISTKESGVVNQKIIF